MNWPWSHIDPAPDPKAEAAEAYATALEKRADVAEESLRRFLRFYRDPWARLLNGAPRGR